MKVCVAGAEFTVIDDAELNNEAISNANHGAAQRDPGHLCRSNDQGRDFSAYFITLNKELKEQIIRRLDG